MRSITTSNGFTMRVDVAGLQSALLIVAGKIERIAAKKLPAKLQTDLYEIAALARGAVYVAEEWAADNQLALATSDQAETTPEEKSPVEMATVPDFGNSEK